ncbi:MAG: RNA-directed DNA polymerase [Planctomycetota bacterium]|nr:RNA-directed DNA polymerase [Planctomycetota bacterium]
MAGCWAVGSKRPVRGVQHWFPGDDLFTPSQRRRGLPIGNQTSQFFANVFLNPFDHFVKEELRVPAYIRYVDDFVIFSDDKAGLATVRAQCRSFLQRRRLQLHPKKSVISRVEDGVRFLGYRVFPGHRLLARENVRRMRRRLKRMQADYAAGELSAENIRRRLQSWIGHVGHADTVGLRRHLFSATTFCRRGAGSSG